MAPARATASDTEWRQGRAISTMTSKSPKIASASAGRMSAVNITVAARRTVPSGDDLPRSMARTKSPTPAKPPMALQ